MSDIAELNNAVSLSSLPFLLLATIKRNCFVFLFFFVTPHQVYERLYLLIKLSSACVISSCCKKTYSLTSTESPRIMARWQTETFHRLSPNPSAHAGPAGVERENDCTTKSLKRYNTGTFCSLIYNRCQSIPEAPYCTVL